MYYILCITFPLVLSVFYLEHTYITHTERFRTEYDMVPSTIYNVRPKNTYIKRHNNYRVVEGLVLLFSRRLTLDLHLEID